MATERVLEIAVRRHVIDAQRPCSDVLDGIFSGISQPDIAGLFGELEASTSYEQYSALVRQAQGSAGLMRFWPLDLDNALTLDPQAAGQAGLRLVRLIAGNPSPWAPAGSGTGPIQPDNYRTSRRSAPATPPAAGPRAEPLGLV